VPPPTTSVRERTHPAARIDHLDWLRVLALLGVFVFHTLRPFDTDYWHVKSAQQSEMVTEVLVSLASWGLSFFFLVSGAATYLALRWRTPGVYVRERMLRLAIPLLVGWTCSDRPSSGWRSTTTRRRTTR